MFFNSILKIRPSRRQFSASGSPRGQVPARAPRRPIWWLYGAALVCVFAVVWALFSHRYYAWALGDERINIVVFCDTADLNDPDLKAGVLYDQVALTPVARALGLYQNRPPGQVRVFFPLPIRKYTVNAVSITLHDVPWGPISRVVFVARGRRYNVAVPDRRLVKGALYVRVGD